MASAFTSTTSALIAPASSARSWLSIWNEGAGILYVHVGPETTGAVPTVTSSNYSFQIPSGAGFAFEPPTGVAVYGIFGSAGTARITHQVSNA